MKSLLFTSIFLLIIGTLQAQTYITVNAGGQLYNQAENFQKVLIEESTKDIFGRDTLTYSLRTQRPKLTLRPSANIGLRWRGKKSGRINRLQLQYTQSSWLVDDYQRVEIPNQLIPEINTTENVGEYNAWYTGLTFSESFQKNVVEDKTQFVLNFYSQIFFHRAVKDPLISDFFRERSYNTGLHVGLNPELIIPIAGNRINLVFSARAHILSMLVDFTTSENPSLTTRQQTNGGFDFDILSNGTGRAFIGIGLDIKL